MQRHVFDAAELGANLDDRARFALWREMYGAIYGAADINRFDDSPFRMRTELVQLGDFALAHSAGTFSRYARTGQHAATDTRGDFILGFVRGPGRMRLTQRPDESIVGVGEVALFTNAEACEGRAEQHSAWIMLALPRQRLLDEVSNAEDRIVRPLDAGRPAVRHLDRYVSFLLNSSEIAGEPELIEHARTTLFDLVVLSLGGRGDAAEIAAMRGMRAARIREVLAAIEVGFAHPGFSARHVAIRLGLSPRYVQDLLQETGASFTERVMELRLQKVRTMLADRRHDRRKISEIAMACGFGEISYFNQCFRRRFGASPSQYRGGER